MPIDGSEMPSRSIAVAAECRSRWAPRVGADTPARTMARFTMFETHELVANARRGARDLRKTRSHATTKRRPRR